LLRAGCHCYSVRAGFPGAAWSLAAPGTPACSPSGTSTMRRTAASMPRPSIARTHFIPGGRPRLRDEEKSCPRATVPLRRRNASRQSRAN